MSHIEQLQDIANRQLGGLRATPKMLGEIKLAAARKRDKAAVRRVWRPALAVGAALLVCIGIYAQTGKERMPLSPVPSHTVLDSQTAGGGEQAATLKATERALLDVPPGSISLGPEKETPAYRNLFAKGQGSTFPLVTVEGATYRMLKTPASIEQSLLGDSLGQVTEYTLEPALSTGGAVSNVVSQGETVYAVQGMRGAMAAALVEGTLRVFQRVSFAGGAIVGNENLEDTLCAASQVVSMELSDVGIIDDAQKAQELMQILLDNASYQSASISSGGSKSLIIGMDNGLLLQLIVGEDTVSACGTWSCPEFFEEFIVAME
ncbi:MAG: hypothetical protein GXY67_07665 [Clostridiales bacterium]|nr:hypothetical protein [Clostridiales bacterium]